MKYKTIFCQAVFLFLFPIIAINAAPQSFFAPSGQVIKNKGTARMYCLEKTKEVMKADNLGDLTNIIGDVRVLYKNGTEQIRNFSELYNNNNGVIRIIPHNSYEYMQLFFTDESIEQITIGDEGISLRRKKMTDYEIELSEKNIERIHELEEKGLSHAQIQRYIWRTRVPKIIYDQDKKIEIIDFQTTDDEEKKVHGIYGGSATVSYQRGGQTFMRIDGLLGSNNILIEDIIELITHYHNDHINPAILAQVLEEKKFQRIVGPNPKLKESRNNTFDLLNQNVNKSVHEHVIDIAAHDGTPLDLKFTSVGDFIHSKFKVNDDIIVEVFKYQKPENKVNDDGLIYQITHNGVSQLLFGDIDDIDAIDNLLDASLANEKRCYEIDEEISTLRKDRIKIRDEAIYYNYLQEQFPMIYPQKVNNKLQQLFIDYNQIEQKITKLEEEKSGLPFLKADIIKWMHHAHVFSEKRAYDVIKKLYDVIEPQYIIWQRYNNQTDVKFNDFIEPLPFKDKCLNSSERVITVISLEYIIKQILFS